MSFDPYHRWLGIPPAEQPPNHYRLLGIAVFETDPDVISNAADRQLAHVKTFHLGEHAAESQRLLSEIVTASRCLLDPDARAAYDARLRLANPGSPTLPPAGPRLSIEVSPRPKRGQRTHWIAVSSAVSVVALAMLVVFVGWQRGRNSGAATSAPTSAPTSAMPSAQPAGKAAPPTPSFAETETTSSDAEEGLLVGLEFDGSAWIDTDLQYDGSTPLTIEAWVTPAAHHLQSIVANCHGVGLALQITKDGQWGFFVRDQKSYRGAVSNETVRLAQRAHVAGVFDDRVVRLFVNGRLQETIGTLTSAHKVSRFRFMIGADPDFHSRPQMPFEGIIDSVRVSRAALYKDDFEPQDPFTPTPATALLLQLDEGQGSVGIDSSAHNQRVTIHGGKWRKGPFR